MAQTIFGITIFVSAFLLFLVQPLIGKLILPKLGGTPQVWNTCMVFFQSVLLLGYAYTHTVSTRLKLRQQLMLHGAVLLIPVIMMIMFPVYSQVQEWTPPSGSNPIFNTLGLLALIIGVPFFVVSTSAPLLQKWFAYSGHSSARDPYFLYAISNLGSLLSLLVYPLIIEPYTILSQQSYIFFGGYIALALCIFYCAYTISQLAPGDDQIAAAESTAAATLPPVETAPAPAPLPETAPAVEAGTAIKAGQAPGARGIQRKKGIKLAPAAAEEKPTPSIIAHTPTGPVRGAEAEMSWWRRLRWIMLAFVPSSLMLGVTNYISTDMSPFPLVWVIPLALYLISFIVVYDKFIAWTSKRYTILNGNYTLQDMMLFVGQPLGVIVLCFISIRGGFDVVGSTLLVVLGFFANALACHGELARDRPTTRNLTEYFLLMSVGGMLGGLFNGIIAPNLFQGGIYEYYIVLVIACMIRPEYVPVGWFDDLVLNAFPGFKTWVVNQGNEMAKSMGKPEPNSTYLFSYFLDIVLGAFVLCVSYWLRYRYFDAIRFANTGEPAAGWLFNTMSFLGMKMTRTSAQEGFVPLLRVALTLGPPLVFLFFFAGRPFRFALATAGLLFGILFWAQPDRGVLESRRTYFGLLRVLREDEMPRDPIEQESFIKRWRTSDGRKMPPDFFYNYLMHGTTYHGRNYIYEADEKGKDSIADMSRLATTYYHRYGPIGPVMERYNWFPGKQNDFSADARLPAALVGQIAAGTGILSIPASTLVEPWTEPPFATIGLGTGTMASYARPYEWMTYYEIDDVMRRFSLPEDESEKQDFEKPGHFTYLQNAIRRGVNLEVIMGDARLTMQREKNNLDNAMQFSAEFAGPKGKELPANRPYAKVPYQWQPTKVQALSREGFYKVIVVDAFSSDAIPIHLVTKEAIKLYLDKLTPDGVLCVHTSNRHMDLVRPVARIAKELSDEAVKANKDETKDAKIYCMVGKDRIENYGREWFMGHYSSEYVMIYRDEKLNDYFTKLYETHDELFQKWAENLPEKHEGRRFPLIWEPPAGKPILRSKVQWYDPYADQSFVQRGGGRYVWHQKVTTTGDPLWTDDYSHILSVVRWHLPENFWVIVSVVVIAFAIFGGVLFINRKP